MKFLKKTILGSLFGLSFMLFSFGTNISEVDNLDNDFCGTVFTICDTANPDDISGFGQCMNRNGCSGGTVITEAQ